MKESPPFHQAWCPPVTRILLVSANQNSSQSTGRNNTCSLPVQKLDASLANQVTTPRSSSGRPSRPSGFSLDHFSNNSGCLSRNSAVILSCSLSNLRKTANNQK